jgi:predicted alpha/beta-hydrolase family hydrolase
MNSPFLSFVHEALAARGMLSVKFNFPYKERRGNLPDRAPLLEATWRALIAAVCNDVELAPARLFLGGKSMGGRIASQVVAAGERCNGLVFLGYPLHPPRRPERLRAHHLQSVSCSMLFVQGTRDALCDLALLREVLERVRTPSTLHVIDGADHSFRVPKRSERTESDVLREITEVVACFLSARDQR